MAFQFTHPGRGATWCFWLFRLLWSRFNSRTPGGVRRIIGHVLFRDITVSIHAPREGCDQYSRKSFLRVGSFNSRTPGGVRLGNVNLRRPTAKVSIHAPREGCDGTSSRALISSLMFQFTHPGRGATYTKRRTRQRRARRFNSRTPGGVRR